MKRLIVMGLLLSQTSCVPAAIVGGVMASNGSKKSNQQWTAEFNKNNVERTKVHLPPLDWCEEAFKYNQGFAKKNKECETKLVAENKIKATNRHK